MSRFRDSFVKPDYGKIGFFLLCPVLLSSLLGAFASDPIVLEGQYDVLDLSEYARPLPAINAQPQLQFTIQNINPQDLRYVIVKPLPHILLQILGVAQARPSDLRIFSSSGEEFFSQIQDEIIFPVRVGVTTYRLIGAHEDEQLWLWTPQTRENHQENIRGLHIFLTGFLIFALILSIAAALYKRNMNALWVTMIGASALIFLAHIWQHHLSTAPLFALLPWGAQTVRWVMGFCLAALSLLFFVAPIFLKAMRQTYWQWALLFGVMIMGGFIWQFYFILGQDYYADVMTEEISLSLIALWGAYGCAVALFAPRRLA